MSKYYEQAKNIAYSVSSVAQSLEKADGGARNAVLLAMADGLIKNEKNILDANSDDIKQAKKNDIPSPMIERLTLNKKYIINIAQAVEQIAAQPDPVGKIIDGWVRPNGLSIKKIRVPLGVILVIYESRPNVTIDAAALCIKSGNACILRGGKEAINTNIVLGEIITKALNKHGFDKNCVQVVNKPDREIVPALLALDQYIDLVVPRGGKGLIKTVMQYSKIPVLKHLDGNCHIYVDRTADLELALPVIINAKVSRPSTCNAVETLLVHEEVAEKFLPVCLKKLSEEGVVIKADEKTRKYAQDIKTCLADNIDWETEYNDLTIAVAVTPSIYEAIEHINTYGSKHTEAIIAQDISVVEKFSEEVDAASIMINTSTRFADGYEYGLGAEIGISTDKLHARGPVGLEGLTTYKWVVRGQGQIRS